MKILSGEDSECLWIDNHPEYYRDKDHQELVKSNIRKRYKEQREENERKRLTVINGKI